MIMSWVSHAAGCNVGVAVADAVADAAVDDGVVPDPDGDAAVAGGDAGVAGPAHEPAAAQIATSTATRRLPRCFMR
jgi:hypothetical protein